MMRCTEIKPGMFFNTPDGRLFEVIEEGNYLDAGDGVRKLPIDNTRKNKWWCRRAGTADDPVLMCFSEVFDNDKCRFRSELITLG